MMRTASLLIVNLLLLIAFGASANEAQNVFEDQSQDVPLLSLPFHSIQHSGSLVSFSPVKASSASSQSQFSSVVQSFVKFSTSSNAESLSFAVSFGYSTETFSANIYSGASHPIMRSQSKHESEISMDSTSSRRYFSVSLQKFSEPPDSASLLNSKSPSAVVSHHFMTSFAVSASNVVSKQVVSSKYLTLLESKSMALSSTSMLSFQSFDLSVGSSIPVLMSMSTSQLSWESHDIQSISMDKSSTRSSMLSLAMSEQYNSVKSSSQSSNADSRAVFSLSSSLVVFSGSALFSRSASVLLFSKESSMNLFSTPMSEAFSSVTQLSSDSMSLFKSYNWNPQSRYNSIIRSNFPVSFGSSPLTPTKSPTALSRAKLTIQLVSFSFEVSDSKSASKQISLYKDSTHSMSNLITGSHESTLISFLSVFASHTLSVSRKSIQTSNGENSAAPVQMPTRQPTEPSNPPATQTTTPTSSPSTFPSSIPATNQPTSRPSVRPSIIPSNRPTAGPSSRPTSPKTHVPTLQPSSSPPPTIISPTAQPSSQLTNVPYSNPSCAPTVVPSIQHSSQPTSLPSNSVIPSTSLPTSLPSPSSSCTPTEVPSTQQTSEPTGLPTNLAISSTSLPTSIPSSDPSETPTGIPSTQQSTEPTNLPTNPAISITSLPTSFPTSSPSDSPLVASKQPSSEPTRHSAIPSSSLSTTEPSSEPTIMTSPQPSSWPTSVPSSQPSPLPTLELTTSPSSALSQLPSSYQTIYSSLLPTIRPTNQPNAQPSGRPSSQPSWGATLEPIANPTSMPTGQLSYQLISLVSAWPSSFNPSSQPSILSTLVTTDLPSNQPTPKPSSLSVSEPTTLPTGQPSGQPSRQPTTHPTGQPNAVLPFSPTAPPSQISPWLDSQTQFLIQWNLPNTILYKETSSPSVDLLSGGCSDWESFQYNVAKSFAVQNVKNVIFQQYGLSSVTSNITCRDSTTAITIARCLLQPSTSGCSKSITCNQAQWQVSSSSISVTDSTGAITTNYPCPKSTSTQGKGYIRFIIVQFAAKQPAPGITFFSTATSTSVTVTITLSYDGQVYCGAFSSSSIPTIDSITSQNTMAVSSDSSASITINSLVPSTNYYIYCYSKSFDGLTSTVTSPTSQNPVKTSCCRKISVNLNINSMKKDLNPVVGVLDVSVDALPSTPVIVVPYLILPADLLVNGENGKKLFSPSQFEFSSSSAMSVTFSIYKTDTVANLQLQSSYTVDLLVNPVEDYSPVFLKGNTITVLDPISEPSPPSLAAARFSNDGSSVSVDFSGDTNRAGKGYSSFLCSQLFVFDEALSCRFQTLARLSISLGSSVLIIPDKTVLQLRSDNSLRAACTSTADVCAKWKVANSGITVTAASPSSPLTPVVQIVTASIIGQCTDITLDLSASIGSGGRAWIATFRALSDAPNVNKVQSFLNSYTSYDGSLISIKQDLLDTLNSYTFNVKLCNFLGSCGQASVSVTVLDLSLPMISIQGGSQITTYRSNVLMLASSASTIDCQTQKPSYQNLAVTWSISSTSDMSVIQFSAKDQLKFVAPSFSLKSGSSYLITATVLNKANFKSNSASVTVYVAPSRLFAKISGGAAQSVRVMQTLLMDGSGSYDADQYNYGNADLQFDWTCTNGVPGVSSVCLGTLDGLQQSLAKYTAPDDTTAVVFMTLTVSSLTPIARVDSTKVTITVIPAVAPLVIVNGPNTPKVLPTSQLVITGKISYTGSGTFSWAVSDPTIDLGSVALTSINAQLSTSQTVVSPTLVISAGVLPSTTLTFTLTCTSISSKSTVSASVDVVVNGPPIPGKFSVNPPGGIELTDSFQFTALSWVDEDLPLTYEFSFQLTATQSRQVVQAKSALSYASGVTLPAGLQSNGYVVYCVARIFDSYASYTSQEQDVKVTEGEFEASDLLSLASSSLEASAGNPDAARQFVSTFGSVVNRVNCTMAINCTTIGRYSCSQVDHTCGECLPGLLGASGNKNDKCSSLQELQSRRLSSDNETSKACSYNCSANGMCSYIDSWGKSVADCPSSSYSCSPICTCFPGYTGPICSVTEKDAVSKSSIRESLADQLQLLIGLDYPDIESVQAWAASAKTISQLPFELSDSLITGLLNSSLQIVTTATDYNMASSTVDGVLSALDNVVSSTQYSFPSKTDILTTNTSDMVCVTTVIDQLAILVGDSLLVGQHAQQSILENFRMISQVFGSSDNVTLQSARSSFESAVNLYNPSSVSYGGNASGSFQLGLSGLISESFVALNSSSAVNCRSSNTVVDSMTNLISRPIRTALTSSIFECADGNSGQHLNFTLKHTEAVEFDLIPLNETFAVNCQRRQRQTHYHTCGNGYNVSVYCDGSWTGIIESDCPEKIHLPTCHVLDSTIEGFNSSNCYVSSYTAWETMCVCKICDVVPSGSDSHVGRRLGSTSTKPGFVELTSVSSYVASDFASKMTTAAQFDDVQSFMHALIVFLTFVVLWGFVILMACAGFLYRRSFKAHGKDASLAHHTELVEFDGKDWQKNNAIRTKLETYLTSYLPEIFADRPLFERLTSAILRNHRYLQPHLQEGEEQICSLLAILSNITVSMFLLAVLYDLQWPSDDGTCDLLPDEASCLAAKSPFDPHQSKCYWDAYNFCTWQIPTFSVMTMVAITIVVAVISTPISVFIHMYSDILLKSKSARPEDKFKSFRSFRSRRELSGRGGELEANKRKSAAATSTSRFSLAPPPDVVPSLKRQSINANRTASTVLTGWKKKQLRIALKDPEYHYSIDNLANDLRQQLQLIRNRRDRERFLRQWPEAIFTQSDEEGSNSAINNDADVMLLANEIEKVRTEVKQWEEQLQDKDYSYISVKLLELFMIDILGRNSSYAKLLMNRFTNMQQIYYFPRALKIAAFVFLLALDGYFIFACMLYGKEKGFAWQYGWLIACVANLLVDICIQELQIAANVFFVIPNMAYRASNILRVGFKQAIEGLWRQTRYNHLEENNFSAANYLFVSSHLARLYPDLLESALILSFQSLSVPSKLSHRWHSARRNKFITRLRHSISSFDFLRAFSLTITSTIMFVGSQSIPKQRLIAGVFNPAFTAVVSYIGTLIINSTLLGTIVAVIVVVTSLYAAHRYWLKVHNERKEAKRKAKEMHGLVLIADGDDGNNDGSDEADQNARHDVIDSRRILNKELSQKRFYSSRRLEVELSDSEEEVDVIIVAAESDDDYGQMEEDEDEEGDDDSSVAERGEEQETIGSVRHVGFIAEDHIIDQEQLQRYNQSEDHHLQQDVDLVHAEASPSRLSYRHIYNAQQLELNEFENPTHKPINDDSDENDGELLVIERAPNYASTVPTRGVALIGLASSEMLAKSIQMQQRRANRQENIQEAVEESASTSTIAVVDADEVVISTATTTSAAEQADDALEQPQVTVYPNKRIPLPGLILAANALRKGSLSLKPSASRRPSNSASSASADMELLSMESAASPEADTNAVADTAAAIALEIVDDRGVDISSDFDGSQVGNNVSDNQAPQDDAVLMELAEEIVAQDSDISSEVVGAQDVIIQMIELAATEVILSTPTDDNINESAILQEVADMIESSVVVPIHCTEGVDVQDVSNHDGTATEDSISKEPLAQCSSLEENNITDTEGAVCLEEMLTVKDQSIEPETILGGAAAGITATNVAYIEQVIPQDSDILVDIVDKQDAIDELIELREVHQSLSIIEIDSYATSNEAVDVVEAVPTDGSSGNLLSTSHSGTMEDLTTSSVAPEVAEPQAEAEAQAQAEASSNGGIDMKYGSTVELIVASTEADDIALQAESGGCSALESLDEDGRY